MDGVESVKILLL